MYGYGRDQSINPGKSASDQENTGVLSAPVEKKDRSRNVPARMAYLAAHRESGCREF